MQILNIAGYKFIPLHELNAIRVNLLKHCHLLALKGTILLSQEGININLAGTPEAITAFKEILNEEERFSHIQFHHTYSEFQSFKRLKVKLKKEIITLRKPEIKVSATRAPSISPETFKHWLDENHDITILDTRNEYEISFGTFKNALNLHIDDFTSFPNSISQISREKPVVMFCTGGIRCEKAALYLLSQGYQDVFQLEGGILGYFTAVGAKHYEGECFVFDERIALDSHLNATLTKQCQACENPITTEQQSPAATTSKFCPACLEKQTSVHD